MSKNINILYGKNIYTKIYKNKHVKIGSKAPKTFSNLPTHINISPIKHI